MGVLWFSSVRTGRCWYSAEGPHLKLSPSCGVGKDRYTVPAPSLLPIHCNAVQQKPLVETLFLRTVQTCSSCDVPNLSCCVGNTFKRWRKWDWLSACKRIPQFVLLHTNSLKVYLHCTGGGNWQCFPHYSRRATCKREKICPYNIILRHFPHPSKPALEPTQLPIQWVQSLSQG